MSNIPDPDTGRSLARRLNSKLLSRRFASYLSFDFFLLVLAVCSCLLYAEVGAAGFWRAAEQDMHEIWHLNEEEVATWGSYAGPGFSFSETSEISQGWFLPPLNVVLPRMGGVVRAFTWEGNPLQSLPRWRYDFTFGVGPSYYVFSAHIGQMLFVCLILLGLLVFCQMFSFISEAGKNSRDIMETLRPLRELSDYARALSAGVGSAVELSAVAEALETISGTDMDERVPLRGLSEELRPLVQAVNAMLDRLDTSYRSQIRFVSDASHELRTPIAVIHGYANLLTRWGAENPETLKEAVQAIKTEAESMKGLVDQLLFLARGDSDSIPMEPKSLQLADIAAEVLREIEMIDPEHRYEFRSLSAAPMQGDAGLIKQLLRIIVDNSIKYTPPGGAIIITAGEQETGGTMKSYLTVTDEGEGIPVAALPHVFDRFFRADPSRSGTTGGAGLGLSIAKWIVERHGGTLSVTSRQGVGTRMQISFPQS
jgi:signal transduction histidine kinase